MSLITKITTTAKTHKITITGSGSIVAVLALLATLTAYGVTITTSGNIQCSGTVQNPCISFVNITTTNYAIVFPKATIYVDNDLGVNFTVYKLSATNKWVVYNISGKTIPVNTTWMLKIIGYKYITDKNVSIIVGSGGTINNINWIGTVFYPYESCSESSNPSNCKCDLYPLNLTTVSSLAIKNCKLTEKCC